VSATSPHRQSYWPNPADTPAAVRVLDAPLPVALDLGKCGPLFIGRPKASERGQAAMGADTAAILERRLETPEQSDLWSAGQDRLADHWHTHLGPMPLPDEHHVLTCAPWSRVVAWSVALKDPPLIGAEFERRDVSSVG